VALHLAADEARGRADDLGLQRAGEGGALRQGQAAVAKHRRCDAGRCRALQLAAEEARARGGGRGERATAGWRATQKCPCRSRSGWLSRRECGAAREVVEQALQLALVALEVPRGVGDGI